MKYPFDKYELYSKSVQSVESDVDFINETYLKLNNKKPYFLTEDFCGAYKLCCHWVAQSEKHKAYGVDLSEEALSYGKNNHETLLSEDQRQRIKIFKENTLTVKTDKGSDVIAAFNFSYFLLKERKDLKKYFENVYKRLKKGGMFFMDSFGGPGCMEENEESVEYDDFTYYWDQVYYDFIKQESLFHIHFQLKDKEKAKEVFSYHWRMWGIRELKDILEEVGFKEILVYSQKDDEEEFSLEHSLLEELDSYLVYIVCRK